MGVNKLSHPFYIFSRDELRYVIALFILGIILGALFLNLYISKKMDTLILKKKELQKNITQQKQQIQKLKKNLKKHKREFIKEANIKIKTDLNQHAQQEVKSKIYQLLDNQIGKEISKFDPLDVIDIFDNRYIPIEDKKFLLNFQYLIIYNEEMFLHLKVNDNN